jgi:hypothetical protein
MRGGEVKEGSPKSERGDCMGDGSLQSHSGANRIPKTAKDRGNVPKGGEAGGVALTLSLVAKGLFNFSKWVEELQLQSQTTKKNIILFLHSFGMIWSNF